MKLTKQNAGQYYSEAIKPIEESIKEAYNVEDVCVGFKRVRGEITDEPAVRLFPKEKGSYSSKNKIPTEIDGFPTDVETNYVAYTEDMFDPMGFTTKYRPLVNGCSIGNEDITAGTLGFLYWKGGQYYWLSNAHVLCADPFKSISEQSTRNIFQPGPYHGGNEKVGLLRYMILLNQQNSSGVDRVMSDGTIMQSYNTADAALALPDSDSLLSTDSLLEDYVAPQISSMIAELGDKTSYTTWQMGGLTGGEVIDLGKAVNVDYGGPIATVADCVITTKASGPGSSGSGVSIKRDGMYGAVGLNFAGNTQYNIVCAIQHIDTAFSGRVVTAGELNGGGDEPPIEPPKTPEYNAWKLEGDIGGVLPFKGTITPFEDNQFSKVI